MATGTHFQSTSKLRLSPGKDSVRRLNTASHEGERQEVIREKNQSCSSSAYGRKVAVKIILYESVRICLGVLQSLRVYSHLPEHRREDELVLEANRGLCCPLSKTICGGDGWTAALVRGESECRMLWSRGNDPPQEDGCPSRPFPTLLVPSVPKENRRCEPRINIARAWCHTKSDDPFAALAQR